MMNSTTQKKVWASQRKDSALQKWQTVPNSSTRVATCQVPLINRSEFIRRQGPELKNRYDCLDVDCELREEKTEFPQWGRDEKLYLYPEMICGDALRETNEYRKWKNMRQPNTCAWTVYRGKPVLMSSIYNRQTEDIRAMQPTLQSLGMPYIDGSFDYVVDFYAGGYFPYSRKAVDVWYRIKNTYQELREDRLRLEKENELLNECIEETANFQAGLIACMDRDIGVENRRCPIRKDTVYQCGRNIHIGCNFCLGHCGCVGHGIRSSFPINEVMKLRWTNVQMGSEEEIEPEYIVKQRMKALHDRRREENAERRAKRVSEIRKRRKEEKHNRVNAEIGIDINHKFPKLDLNVTIDSFLQNPQVMELLADLQSTIKTTVSLVKVIKEIGFCMLHIYQASFSRSSVFTSIGHLISNVGLGGEFKTKAIDIWERFMTRVHTNAQSGEVPPQTGTLAAGVLSVVGFILVAATTVSGKSEKKTEDFLTKMSKLGGTITCVDKLSDKIGPMIECVIDYVRVNWFGYGSKQLDSWKFYEKWCDEVCELNTVDFEKNVAEDEQIRIKIDDLIMRGDKIAKIFDSIRLPNAERTRFSMCQVFLVKARCIAAQCEPGENRPRVPPGIYHFVGASGIGKTEMTNRLMARLLVALGHTDPHDMEKFIYHRNPCDDRYDGYTNQIEGVMVDDIGAVRDTVNKPNPQFPETIHMSNSVPWMLPMAHLSNKGSTFFQAKFVIWTSNISHFSIESMTNPYAVERRVGLKFRQVPHPDYAVDQMIGSQRQIGLNRAKVERECLEDPLVYEKCWRFIPIDPWSLLDTPIGEPLTFEEMAITVEKHMMDNIRSGELKINANVDYFKKMVEKRQAAQANSQMFSIPSVFKFGTTTMPDVGHGTERHVTSQELLSNYEAHAYDLSAIPVDCPHDFSHLMDHYCFSIRPATVDRFGAAYVTAMASVSIPRPGDTHEVRKQIFNRVFFSMWSSSPQLIGLCEEHEGPSWLQERWKFLVTHVRSLLGKIPPRNQWPAWVNVTYEYAALFLMTMGIFVVISVVDWICKALVRKLWSRDGAWEYFEKRGGPIYAYTMVYDTFGFLPIDPGHFAHVHRHPMESFQEKTVGSARRNVEGSESFQDPHFGVRKNVESFQEKTQGKRSLNVENVNIESTVDVNANEIMTKVMRQQYGLFGKGVSSWYRLGTVTMLAGRVGITNAHIVRNLPEQLFIRSAIQTTPIYFSRDDLNICPNGVEFKDIGLIEFPAAIRTHSDIRHLFSKSGDLGRFSDLTCVGLCGSALDGAMQRVYSSRFKAQDRFELNDAFVITTIRDVYKYDCQTARGDCGMMIIAYDPSMERKILGIHMAGDVTDVSYPAVGTSVTQENIAKLLDGWKMRRPESLMNAHFQLPDEAELLDDLPFTGDFLPIARVPPVYSSKKTKIRKGPLYGIIQESVTAPARLGTFVSEAGEFVDPLEMARRKASTPVVVLERDLENAAIDSVRQMVISGKDYHDCVVLTVEQAIRGIEGDEAYSPIKRQTSPGYGWDKCGTGKEMYLGKDQEWNFTHPLVVERLECAHAKLKRGERLGTIWTDTLKDERRSLDKVKKGKTRLFAAGELTFLIVFRQFFMGFAAHMYKNRIHKESTIGINVYSREWDILARRMRRQGPHVVAGDFTNYDGTLNASLLWGCLDIINEFYNDGEENAAIRRLLWMDIVHSIHVSHDTIYGWTHSQPSGCPITSILNSLYHSVVARYVYLLCARKYSPEHATMADFSRLVEHASYGDDDLYNIHPDIIEWYNQKTMSEMFPLVGMTYTDEEKNENASDNRVLGEVSFLKRRFRWDEQQQRFRAPLSVTTILEMAMWVKRSTSAYELSAQALEMAHLELAQHDRETYDKEFVKLDRAREYLFPFREVIFDTYEIMQFRENVKYNGVELYGNPVDRGCAQMGVESQQQNLRQVEKSEGGLFSPSDECEPSKIQTTHPPFEARSLNQDLIFEINRFANQKENDPMILTSERETDKQEVMNFIEEGAVQQVEVTDRMTLEQPNAPQVRDSLSNDIIGYLSRPLELQTFVWPTSSVSNTNLVNIPLMRSYTAQAMIREKIAGFRYLKCDFVVKVQVNAQPFNAGRLLIYHNPYYDQMVSNPSSIKYLSGKTGYPHVELDVNTDTSCEIRIPFHGPISHFDLVQGTGTLGNVFVDIYSRLSGGADVDGTVWLWAENIDITMPTGATQRLPPLATNSFDVVNAQGGMEKKNPGNVELMSSKIGSVAKGLMGFPVIGAAASAVSWAADIVRDGASLFGFSKPRDPDFSKPVGLRYASQMANYNGTGGSRCLALDARNEMTVPTASFGTEVDEMAIDSIVRRYNFVKSFMFNATDAQKARIFEFPVTPQWCDYESSTSAPFYILFKNVFMSYLSNFFRFWRGGIKYRFKAVKTAFHSGRVRIYYVPGNNIGGVYDRNKCYSVLWDIRTDPEIEFTVPYVANSPWSTMKQLANKVDPLSSWDQTGRVFVEVVNTLRASSVAAQSIEILVETAAADDFEFAYPDIWDVRFRLVPGTNMQPSAPAQKTPSVNAQGGLDMIVTPGVNDVDIHSHGVGEKITSLRQVLKRLTVTTLDDVAINFPFVAADYGMSNPAALERPDFITGLGFLYRLYSGTMRYLHINPTEEVITHFVRFGGDVAPSDFTGPVFIQNGRLEPLFEIDLPFASEVPVRLTPVGNPLISPLSDYWNTANSYNRGPNIDKHTLMTDKVPVKKYRAIGDDFSFGFLIGAPVSAINWTP